MVDGGEAVAFADFREGGEVVRTFIVEEGEVVDGAGGEDARDFAFDDFPGLGCGGLLGDGDAFAGFEEAGDVILRGVVGDATHRGAATLGEGDVHDGSGVFRILEEHFVEIAEAVEEDDVGG